MDSVPYFRSALETSRFEIYRRQHSSCWSKEKQIGFVDAERVRQYKYMNIVLVTGMGSKSQCTFSYFALVCWCRWLCKCASLSICDEQIESHIVPRITPNFLVLPCVVSVPVICPFRVSDHFQSFFFSHDGKNILSNCFHKGIGAIQIDGVLSREFKERGPKMVT